MADPIAYLLKTLPARSATFIHREIDYLRAAGHEVSLFPVWKTDKSALADTVTANPSLNHERFSLFYPLWVFAFLYFFLSRPAVCIRLFSRYRRLYGIRFFAKSIETALLIRIRRIAVIHAHTLSLCASRARVAGRLLDIPYVITAHGSDLLLFPPEDARELIADARAVITPSRYNKKRLLEIAGPDEAGKIRVVGQAVDCGFFSPGDEPRRGRGPAELIMIGGLVQIKGYHIMLRAAARLRDEETAFRLTIVGEGSEREALLAETTRLGLTDVVRFAGALYDQELRDALRRADIFVSSSLSEGLPVAMLEAMAVGLCVVVPRITGIPEVVKHGENGLLFSRGNARELARMIKEAVTDRSTRRRLGTAARKTVVTRFEKDTVYREIVGILFG